MLPFLTILIACVPAGPRTAPSNPGELRTSDTAPNPDSASLRDNCAAEDFEVWQIFHVKPGPFTVDWSEVMHDAAGEVLDPVSIDIVREVLVSVPSSDALDRVCDDDISGDLVIASHIEVGHTETVRSFAGDPSSEQFFSAQADPDGVIMLNFARRSDQKNVLEVLVVSDGADDQHVLTLE